MFYVKSLRVHCSKWRWRHTIFLSTFSPALSSSVRLCSVNQKANTKNRNIILIYYDAVINAVIFWPYSVLLLLELRRSESKGEKFRQHLIKCFATLRKRGNLQCQSCGVFLFWLSSWNNFSAPPRLQKIDFVVRVSSRWGGARYLDVFGLSRAIKHGSSIKLRQNLGTRENWSLLFLFLLPVEKHRIYIILW